MTPRQFYYCGKRHVERERREMRAFQFLATVTAQSMGNDVDYMKDAEPESDGAGWDRLEAYLHGRALHDGAADGHSNQEPPGTPESNEGDGDGGRAEGR